MCIHELIMGIHNSVMDIPLLLGCVSAGIELPHHLGHAYIISNTL